MTKHECIQLLQTGLKDCIEISRDTEGSWELWVEALDLDEDFAPGYRDIKITYCPFCGVNLAIAHL